MWDENYDTYHLLYADPGHTLQNILTDEKKPQVRCQPEEVRFWLEIIA